MVCVTFLVWDALAALATESNNELYLPEVSLKDLENGASEAVGAAYNALHNLGALVVTKARIVDDVEKSLTAWADCLLPGGALHSQGLESARQLAGGRVRRLSVMGKGSLGPHIPSSSFENCPSADASHRALRAGLKNAAYTLARALDRDSRTPRILRKIPDTRNNGAWLSIQLSSALESTSHLEHLHLYQEVQNSSANVEASHNVLQLHTDLGFLLAFVPPLFEGIDHVDSSMLTVEDASGKQRSLVRPQTSDVVIFFVGQTAQLLGQESVFRPLPHSLHLPEAFGWRVWYGMMLLLPDDAIVTSTRSSDLTAGPGSFNFSTFGSIWNSAREAMTNGDSDDVEVSNFACGSSLILADQVVGCGAGQISCWMTCMSTQDVGPCSGGYWLPAVAGGKNEYQTLSVQCRNKNDGAKWPLESGQMCPDCTPACTMESSSSAIPSPSPSTPGTHHPTSTSDFCQSSAASVGVSMYMVGFKMSSTSPDAPCVVFLYADLVLDTPWKFALGCLATIVLCASVEVLSVASRRLPEKRQNDIGALMHVFGLTLAYLAMLLVMTYSVEIFCCVIIGFFIGHVTASCLRRRDQKRSNSKGTIAGSPCCVISRGNQLGERSFLVHELVTSGVADQAYAIELSITGMTCNGCVETVHRALASLEFVASVDVCLEKHSARVLSRCPPTVATANLCDAIASVGFEASPMSPAVGPSSGLPLSGIPSSAALNE